jgi:hypothetical protein
MRPVSHVDCAVSTGLNFRAVFRDNVAGFELPEVMFADQLTGEDANGSQENG